MKVNEFVKEYGLECVRGIVNNSENHWAYDHILDEYFNGDDIQDGYSINDCEGCYVIDDLKHLVEAHELVESYGGLEVAKTCEYSEDLDHVKYNVDLAKAINLVESCQ